MVFRHEIHTDYTDFGRILLDPRIHKIFRNTMVA